MIRVLPTQAADQELEARGNSAGMNAAVVIRLARDVTVPGLNTKRRLAFATVIGTRNLGWRAKPEENLVAGKHVSSGGLWGSGVRLYTFSGLASFLRPAWKRQVTVNYYGGAGGATYLGWNWLNTTGDPGWTVVGANDFNGDGVPDLVWQNDTTAQVTVNYYVGAAGATLTSWSWLAESGYPGWTAVVPR